MHAMSSRPPKHKIACWKEDDTEKSWHETMFWGTEAVLLDVWDQILELVDQKTGNTDQTSDTDCDESETGFAKIEAINTWVDQRESFEERVINSVSQGCLLFCQSLYLEQ